MVGFINFIIFNNIFFAPKIVPNRKLDKEKPRWLELTISIIYIVVSFYNRIIKRDTWNFGAVC